ncbi:MAG: efflux RND transporter periplasmic adaptor subunit [Planctomycetes bacterium]|nr:efflux RND transporter periplasmic adaptor subunit [Planctomycetota bacterium]
MTPTLLRPALLALCLGFLAVSAHGGQPGAVVPAVNVETVRTVAQSNPKTYIGTVSGSETVGIVARVSGTLWNVAFQEGTIVRKGDVLFEIEDTIYKANVAVARARIMQAKANFELARKDHERNVNLLAEKAISAQSFDTTDATRLLREAELEEAEANLVLMEQDLAYCRIVSPLTGRIGEKLYSEGNYITPSLGVLATIVTYQPVKVQFSMSESDYFRYFTGHDQMNGIAVDILRANGREYAGSAEVSFVDNRVDDRTDTIMITLECDNPEDQLLPGGYVQVRLAERYDEPIPAAAVSAFMTDGANHYVYVVTGNNTVERRVVRIGDLVGRYQTVLEGLEPGERVIIGGMNKVVPGAAINPVLSGE